MLMSLATDSCSSSSRSVTVFTGRPQNLQVTIPDPSVGFSGAPHAGHLRHSMKTAWPIKYK
jgi:hypothetical protein